MADIAAIFHWHLSAMQTMSLGELAMWWGKARERATPESE